MAKRMVCAAAVFAMVLPMSAIADPPVPVKIPLRDGTVPYTTAYTVKVVEIISGDVLTVQRGDKRITIHLYGVDAPQSATEAGKAAQALLKDRALNRIAQIETRDKISDTKNATGKMVEARVTLQPDLPTNPLGTPKIAYDPTGTSADQPHGVIDLPQPENERVLNRIVVRAGFAYWDRARAKDATEIADAENFARKAKIGLWAVSADNKK